SEARRSDENDPKPLLLRCTLPACYTRHNHWVWGHRDEAAGGHITAWQRGGGVAARGARGGAGDGGDWLYSQPFTAGGGAHDGGRGHNRAGPTLRLYPRPQLD